jgi:hypothetical protein
VVFQSRFHARSYAALKLLMIVKQKDPLPFGFLQEQRHGLGCLSGRQADVKNVISPLPDRWVIVGHEAEKFHFLREFAEPGGLGNICRANHAANFSLPTPELSFHVGEVIAAKDFLFDGNSGMGWSLDSRQPGPERLIYGRWVIALRAEDKNGHSIHG